MTLNEWLTTIIETERPESSIIAYNFGLFQMEEGYTIYLTGSKVFDEDDSDWATNNDFEPKQKYLELSSEFKKENWEVLLQKMSKSVSLFLESKIGLKSFLSDAKAITIGFDDGDLIRIK